MSVDIFPVIVSVTMALLSAEGRQSPQLVNATEILDLVTHHRGKVILLNFWATWCPPCLGEFPDIVELEEEYRSQGLVVLSVSADPPDRMDSDLVPFLDRHKPGFPVYVKKPENTEEFTRRIDPEWTGRIPTTIFFDRKGKYSVKRYSRMPRREMERIVAALLEEPEP